MALPLSHLTVVFRDTCQRSCGKPEQAVEVSGRFEHGRLEQMSAEALSRLSNEEFTILQRIALAQHAGDAQS